MNLDPAPIFAKAQYAKGMIAVSCPSNGTGLKTRAASIASALNARWSNREKSYIMSPAKAQKLKTFYDAGTSPELGVMKDGKLGYIITSSLPFPKLTMTNR